MILKVQIHCKSLQGIAACMVFLVSAARRTDPRSALGQRWENKDCKKLNSGNAENHNAGN